MKPLVSVVIPTYNRADLISFTIDSVLKQTYESFEIIVVDDGSTDNTLEILSTFGDSIKVFTQNNEGVSSARNKAIKNSSGDWIAFLDSDDLWYPQKLQCQFEKLKSEGDYKWMYCDAEYFDNETQASLGLISDIAKPHTGWVLKDLFMSNFISSPTPVVAREVFDVTGVFHDEKLLPEDWDMWLRIASHFPVCYVDLPLARYRTHISNTSNMSRTFSWYETFVDRSEVALERAVENNPELESFKGRSLSNIYAGLGKSFVRNGDYASSRKFFVQAVKLTRLNPKLYIYLLIAFTGRLTISWLLRFRDMYRARRVKRQR